MKTIERASTPPTTTASSSPRESLRGLVIDIAVPLASYYLARDAFHFSAVGAYTISGIVPAIRTVTSIGRDRTVNPISLLMLTVTIAGCALGLLTGSARLMMAKDSAISSVIAFTILFSVVRGRAFMSAGLEPFLTKGDAARTAAWHKLTTTSGAFHRLELRLSTIWGVALLAECVTRLIGAFTLPVSTMSWLSTVMTIGAIGVACIVGGAVADPLDKMLTNEVALTAEMA